MSTTRPSGRTKREAQLSHSPAANGGAARAGVPVDPRESVARELSPVFTDLEPVQQQCAHITQEASEAAERCLGVLRRFSDDVTELVRAETADWMVEFRSGPAPLALQSVGVVPARPETAHPSGRFPLPPGTRPNMPRQRPPEAR